MIDTLARIVERIELFLNLELFSIGNATLTIGKVIYILVLVLLVLIATKIFGRWFTYKLLARTQMDVGARLATGRLTSYAFAVIGFMVVLQMSGIDLTTLNVFAGAVGVAVGFGLQTVANNFICGLIILFERPIKLGDRIQVGDVHGKVVEIRARSTTIVTNNNISIIIPNSKFIEENVVNWSYKEATIRFEVPVGVAYGSEPRVVEKAILAAASDVEDVLKDPPPDVMFAGFGESSLDFKLRAWTMTQLHQKDAFISQVNFAIHDRLKEFGIRVPFPQRDLHIIDGGVDVRLPSRGEGENTGR